MRKQNIINLTYKTAEMGQTKLNQIIMVLVSFKKHISGMWYFGGSTQKHCFKAEEVTYLRVEKAMEEKDEKTLEYENICFRCD